MKTRWQNIKQTMKNWRWWIALPYMLTFVLLVGGLYLLGVLVEWLGEKMKQPFDSKANILFAKQVLNFIKKGQSK